MNIRSSEDSDKIEEGRFLRFLLGLFPRRINPFYFLILLYRNKEEKKLLANLKMVMEMSDIVDSMAQEDKLSLTIREPEGQTITPQQSFIDYFRRYDLVCLDIDAFKRDFIYLYYVWGRIWIREVEEAGFRNRDSVNLFWERFKNCAPSISGKTKQHKKIIFGLKILMILQSQKLRRLKRVLFSSFSWH